MVVFEIPFVNFTTKEKVNLALIHMHTMSTLLRANLHVTDLHPFFLLHDNTKIDK